MTVKKLFSRFCDSYDISQVEFIDYFNDAMMFLDARYGEKYVFSSHNDRYIETIDDEISVYPEYLDGVRGYLEYKFAGNEDGRVDFIEKSELAFKTVWKMLAKGTVIRGSVW